MKKKNFKAMPWSLHFTFHESTRSYSSKHLSAKDGNFQETECRAVYLLRKQRVCNFEKHCEREEALDENTLRWF